MSEPIDWKARYLELESDRDYWRIRSAAWQERYEIAVNEQEPKTDTLPPSLEIAIDRECTGQPKDIARAIRREVVEAYAKATGHDDERITIAMKRLREGDSARVEPLITGFDMRMES